MVQFLDFDLLFTGLISLFWLVIPSFNIVYLLSSDTFKKTFASSQRWLLNTFTAVQLFMCLMLWQVLTGDFTKFFGMNVSISSVFVTAFQIMNYLFQSGLFYTYVIFVDIENN
ncbi:hypothetical protein FGO68_gene7662 [Halteria grandinella]|uniref:Uncharacterized protein n=1 Tax=Halteria grandinella TaxID=5974 RepID=A0A8J8SYA3_HALGN|nr:hypothetical protein FGO68_gene7662 [Halteria grandinella]